MKMIYLSRAGFYLLSIILVAVFIGTGCQSPVVTPISNNAPTTIHVSALTTTFETSPSQKRAREIMGQNFFGVEEAIKHFGVNPSKEQLTYLAEIRTPKGRLITEEEMTACKDTHVLVAVFPLSILDICGKVDSKFFFNSALGGWIYNKGAEFTKNRGKVGWYLVRKTPVPNSTKIENWNELQTLIGRDEEIPTARVMVYTIIGHFLTTGERLFEHIYVYCSDRELGGLGSPTCVGYFDAEGLDIGASCLKSPHIIVPNPSAEIWISVPARYVYSTDRVGLAVTRKQ